MHDLRAPLHNVLGLLELVETGVYGPVPAALGNPIGLIGAEARRLRGIVEDAGEIVRILGGGEVPNKAPVDVQALVAGLVAIYGGKLSGEPAPKAVQDGARLGRLLDRVLAHAAAIDPPVVCVLGSANLALRITPAGPHDLDAPPVGLALAVRLAELLGGQLRVAEGAFELALPAA
jgi:signal transduction histidine kinase